MEAMDAVGTVAPHADLSIWALFWQADLVVKSVMIGLLVASVWCWAIIVDKSMLYSRVRREMNRFERTFWSGRYRSHIRPTRATITTGSRDVWSAM